MEIRWPSGAAKPLNLTADQHYAVVEGQGIVSVEHARPALAKRPEVRDIADPARGNVGGKFCAQSKRSCVRPIHGSQG